MKKILIVVLAFVAALVFAIPASAADGKPLRNTPDGTTALPLPGELSGNKFASGSICVAIGDASLPIDVAASQWTLRAGSPVNIVARNNCVTAGYPVERRFTIESYVDITDAYCSKSTRLERRAYNGRYIWTNNPVIWVNVTPERGCVSGPTREAHATSAALGLALGFRSLNSVNMNSRVMNTTDYSWNNIGWPSNAEGQLAWSLYSGAYGG